MANANARDMARDAYITWLGTLDTPSPIEAEISFLKLFAELDGPARGAIVPWRQLHLLLVEKFSSWQVATEAIKERTLFTADYSPGSLQVMNWVVAYKAAVQSVFRRTPRPRGRRGQGQRAAARLEHKEDQSPARSIKSEKTKRR